MTTGLGLHFLEHTGQIEAGVLAAFKAFLVGRYSSKPTVACYLSSIRFLMRCAPIVFDRFFFEHLVALSIEGQVDISRQTIKLRVAGANEFIRWAGFNQLLALPFPYDEARWAAKGLKAGKVNMPRIPKETEILAFLAGTAQMIVDAADTDELFRMIRNHAMWQIMAYCGCRRSEVADLLMSSQSVDGKLVVTGKGQKTRVVPMAKRASDALQTYLSARTDFKSDLVFLDFYGQPIKHAAVYWCFNEAKARLGMEKSKFTPHWLRHFCAMSMYRAGVSVDAIMHFLGHNNIETTRRYIKSMGQSQFDAEIDKYLATID